MNDSPIHEGEWLNFIAISTQADEFLRGLSERAWTHFCVAATILESSLRSGRPPAGRAARIHGSNAGLFELRITPPGRRGVHYRLLYLASGRDILCARGIAKKTPAIARREIELAERAVKAYRRGRGESP